MTAKLDYFKLAIQNLKVLESKDWYLYTIAIPILKAMKQPEEELALFTKPDGLYYSTYVSGTWEAVKISDYREGEPLFQFEDKINADPSWLPTISKPIETTIGRMLVNAFVLYGSFGVKVPYRNEIMEVKTFNEILIRQLRDEDKAKGDDIKVSEMVQCFDRLTFISSLATIINVAATKKTISAPEGLEKKKKELLAKYEGQLTDPVKLAEFEGELDKFDRDFLSDDPDSDKILSSKTRTARRKMYLAFGKPSGFDNNATAITSSLMDGLEVSRQNLPQYMDDLRFGSYSRGGSTAKSGYIYKILQRALTSLNVVGTPCNTTTGLVRYITDKDYMNLMDRSVKVSGKWKILSSPEEAEHFVGKDTEIRSPMYCTSPGGTVCYSCLSESYKDSEAGITNLAAVFSDALMSLFLKAMHSTSTYLTTVTMDDLCT
ncbi:putative DNA-directed RNA polymerase [Bacillus phage vB_BspM_AgentSmith]|nr:putative DNA-directed RNA polymerase [Bacillus phage vB_BspM_AgentSmith]